MNKTRRVPFSLEKAKAGAKVCTSEGYEVTIRSYCCGDRAFPLVGEINVGVGEHPIIHRLWRENGTAAPIGVDDEDRDDDLFIEEEVKTRRMTYKELSHWLSPIHGHFRQRLTGCNNVATTLLYSMDEENYEVEEGDLIREDFGEWMEPLIEI